MIKKALVGGIIAFALYGGFVAAGEMHSAYVWNTKIVDASYATSKEKCLAGGNNWYFRVDEDTSGKEWDVGDLCINKDTRILIRFTSGIGFQHVPWYGNWSN